MSLSCLLCMSHGGRQLSFMSLVYESGLLYLYITHGVSFHIAIYSCIWRCASDGRQRRRTRYSGWQKFIYIEIHVYIYGDAVGIHIEIHVYIYGDAPGIQDGRDTYVLCHVTAYKSCVIYIVYETWCVMSLVFELCLLYYMPCGSAYQFLHPTQGCMNVVYIHVYTRCNNCYTRCNMAQLLPPTHLGQTYRSCSILQNLGRRRPVILWCRGMGSTWNL